MTNIERMNFVIWAGQRDPKFTQSRRAYVEALWNWRKVVRGNPRLRMIINASM